MPRGWFSRPGSLGRCMTVGKPPFQALIEEHSRDVLRFLVSAAGPADAEDCYQETFLSALRAYPRLRDTSNLRGWLLTIAARKAVDAHRGRRRRPQPVEAVPEVGVDPVQPRDDPSGSRCASCPASSGRRSCSAMSATSGTPTSARPWGARRRRRDERVRGPRGIAGQDWRGGTEMKDLESKLRSGINGASPTWPPRRTG